MKKVFSVVFAVLFLCLALATPSFAGEIHWYDWPVNSFGIGECNRERYVSDGYNQLDLTAYKEEIYRKVAQGDPFDLKFHFRCSPHNVFSVKEKDLFMAHAILNLAAWIRSHDGDSFAVRDVFVEPALKLESQYFGIPGGL